MKVRTRWLGPTLLTSAVALIACEGGTFDDGTLARSSGTVIPGVAGTASSPLAGSSPVGSSGGPGVGSPGAGGTASSGDAGSSPSGGSEPGCTNKQHPDHFDKNCSIWKQWDEGKSDSEKNCNSDWLTGAGYCLESCGKCTPAPSSGGGGSPSNPGAGSGGSNLGPGPTLPNITSGQVYWASRYWDCCKTHCAWHGAPSCAADGTTRNGGDSACTGGGSYACYDEAPRAVGANVSYGYVAVPNPTCGTCYHLQFTGTGQHNPNDPGSKALAGKHMIVKVTNTGGDVAGNQFDLMVPGGGVGINPDTCKKQWNATDLGPAFGGFLTSCPGSYEEKKACVKQKCSLIPEGDARNGCLWFVDWYQAADNPNFRWEPIECPSDM